MSSYDEPQKIDHLQKPRLNATFVSLLHNIIHFINQRQLLFLLILGKFIDNILYGKSLQDDSKNIHITLISDPQKLDAITREANFIGRQIIDEDLVAVATSPKQIRIHRGYPIGFSVLEKSKLVSFDKYEFQIFIEKNVVALYGLKCHHNLL